MLRSVLEFKTQEMLQEVKLLSEPMSPQIKDTLSHHTTMRYLTEALKVVHISVSFHYDTVTFLQNIHNRHTIACQRGWIMGCLLYSESDAFTWKTVNFKEMKQLYFHSNFIEVCSQVSTGTSDGLALNTWHAITWTNVDQDPWPWFNIKMSSYQYMKSHCGGKTVIRLSCLHNGIPILVRWHL